jgi:uncharacterized protein YyaL (SSP411 family)
MTDAVIASRSPSPAPPVLPFVALLASLGAVACAQNPEPRAETPPGSEAQDQKPVSRPTNRLAASRSPYLQQHAHNPVDWYPWGEEALDRARREQKPIFLSIGYAACHWCHVMERESFENERIAALMNDWFVNIKVDREERPDLDEIYMAATTAMTGHGGWPMSVFLTPDLEPFYAGTYFPPVDSRGMPGFETVLRHIHKLWTERRDEVTRQSARVAEFLRANLAPELAADAPRPEHVAAVLEQSASRFDSEHGGFAQPPQFAPKFPHASELSLLMRIAAGPNGDDAERARKIVVRTLDAMLEGGIHDQLAGGFHRYAVDREWLVPHFEKMLYDNGQLARTYAEAFRLTGDPRYLEVVRATLDHLVDDMRDPEGGFWSSTDADSEGEEGKFFVWDAAEFGRVLGDEADLAMARFGVTAAGNWEGNNVLTRATEVPELARRFEASEAEIEERLAAARLLLLEARSERVPPGTDDKVLAAWNGLAIAGLAAGYQVTGEPRYLDAAREAAAFVLERMRAPTGDGRLLRSWRRGEAGLQGYLEDHAFVAEALLLLFESDFDPRWLREAETLLDAVREHFADDDGSYFFTADDHEQLIARSKSVFESSTPSAIGSLARALLRAGLALGREDLYDAGEQVLRAHHGVIASQGVGAPTLMLAVDFALSDPQEIVIAGEPDDPRTQALLGRVRSAFPPDRVVLLVHDGNREALEVLAPSIVTGKVAIDGVPAAYVCRRGTCDAPVTDPDALALR